jgi:hypothetical protein
MMVGNGLRYGAGNWSLELGEFTSTAVRSQVLEEMAQIT